MNDIKWSDRLKTNAKNLVGWRTDRKIIVISVDDYGNVRLDSKEARDRMEQTGLKVLSRNPGFDLHDSLSNAADLEMLFDVLTSVKDKNGRPAVFTPFALPCNIDFEKVAESGYSKYHYERLTETYSKLSAHQPDDYTGAWDLWQQGIQSGIFIPQFHGREHLNLKVFEESMNRKDADFLSALKNRSYARIPMNGHKTISKYAAFDFWDFEETEKFDEIIREGLDAFEEVFGYRATHFNPPGGREHPMIHKSLKENGIKFIDTPLVKKEHQGIGKYKMVLNYTGKKNDLGQIYMVRNVGFEPTSNQKVDWVSHAMNQIETAFRWKRPAIISSHRVNFCGHIDPENRRRGLSSLRKLLEKITRRWPEVEFMAANELGDFIEQSMKEA